MISSHRCNKREISQRKKSNDSNYLYKSNSLKNYLHNKKLKISNLQEDILFL